jgi:hypothetical protein
VDRTTNRQYPRGYVEDMETDLQRLRTQVESLELDNRSLQHELDQLRLRNVPAATPHACSVEGGTPNASANAPSASPFGSLSEEINVVPSDVTSGRRFVGDSSGLFFGKIVQAVLLQTDYKGEQGPASEALRLRVADSAYGPTSDRSAHVAQFEYPDLDLAHQLQNAYFTCRWPALPFLHWPAFLNNHFGPVMASPSHSSEVSRFITLMVLALGAIDLKRKDKSLSDKHLVYFHYATANYLEGLLRDDSIETVQGLLLIAQFAINEHQSANAWLVVGQAVRTAVDLGLHRTPATVYDLYKFEMRKRVFWATYALDRNVSITLGRPCAIRDEDIDILLPCNITDAKLLAGELPSEGEIALSHPLDMSTFIHIIELRQIQSNIQSLFYAADTTRIQAEGTEIHQTQLRARLEEWIARSPRYSHPSMATFQSTEWFQIAYSHALLLLYRPSPASPMVDATALQICADSAIGLISSYSTLYAKNKITYTWIALHCLFMASITMLYTLNVSHSIRSSTTKIVVKSNIASCLALFAVMAEHWPLAIRCHDIIDRLGNATLALFDAPPPGLSTANATTTIFDTTSGQQHFAQIDTEFMDWFGTRDSQLPFSFENSRHGLQQDAVLSDDSNLSDGVFGSQLQGHDPAIAPSLDDLLSMDFDTTLPMMMNVFGNDFVHANK